MSSGYGVPPGGWSPRRPDPATRPAEGEPPADWNPPVRRRRRAEPDPDEEPTGRHSRPVDRPARSRAPRHERPDPMESDYSASPRRRRAAGPEPGADYGRRAAPTGPSGPDPAGPAYPAPRYPGQPAEPPNPRRRPPSFGAYAPPAAGRRHARSEPDGPEPPQRQGGRSAAPGATAPERARRMPPPAPPVDPTTPGAPGAATRAPAGPPRTPPGQASGGYPPATRPPAPVHRHSGPTARTVPASRPAAAPPPGRPDDALTTTGSGRRRLDELTTTTTGADLRRAGGATGSLTAVRPAVDVREDSRWRGGPHTRLWQAVVGALGVIALLVTCGFFSWRVLQDERTGQGAQAATGGPTATAQPRDISSREADSEPLTVDEVFGADEIPINPADPPYRVLGTQAAEDCSVAAADALAELLDEHGCSQVVRATLRSPDKDFLITGGIFNLKTEDGALEAYEGISPLIEEGTGRFLGLLAGDGTEPIVLSATQLGWDYRGHYLIYTVIARADGAEFAAADDREAELIIWDIAEIHLRTNVLDQRAVAPVGGTPEPTGAPAED